MMLSESVVNNTTTLVLHMRGIPRQSYLDCIPGKSFSARSVSLAHYSMTEVWTLGSTMYDLLALTICV